MQKKNRHPEDRINLLFLFSLKRYWPVIDDALRRAAFDRGVNVSLLISYWNHTWEDMPKYLKSLVEMRSYGYPKIDINVVSFDTQSDLSIVTLFELNITPVLTFNKYWRHWYFYPIRFYELREFIQIMKAVPGRK